MTRHHETVAATARIAVQEWAGVFGAAMGAIADCFKRREPRQAAAELTSGLLMELETRNCWTLAEAVGHRSPDRFQHLLARAKFDHEAARRKIAEQVAVHLAGQEIVLVADETGDEKASEYAVGAAHQYSGAIGGTAKCQVAVHLVAVTARIRVMIDRKLYLPQGWAADDERRELAGVPDELEFSTKPDQAVAMVRDALDAGVRADWFAGDEVYSSRALRHSMREMGLGYTVAVKQNQKVTLRSGLRIEARKTINTLTSGNWMRMATGQGGKGTREYYWSMIDICPDDTPEGHEPGTSALIARRHRYTHETSFYLCHHPQPFTLAKLIEVICRRWGVEEAFQLGKSFVGLDQGQVTCWNSWHRWSLFSMIASIVLTLTQTATTARTAPDWPPDLAPVSCPELLKLLRTSALPRPARDNEHVVFWSAWRLHHQAVAQACHRQRHHRHDQP
ncbi:IS701 family transposase [Streptomyces sp. NBC_01264]|uniref:IS701 family transposase n=1 Tax=Streptomyces sp. NBC_01264 TaxID=2903804 RepID=UPI00224EE94A|nr:IS701 family transposase [Streptomyces sp. NBC_01264]MCX4784212.1 IS701 family transposase [Streptomyces sp. NBC_01264]